MATSTKLRDDSKLLYADLTRRVIGVLFGVFNELTYGFQERHYQRAVALRLEKEQIPFQRELYHPIYFEEKIIGRYYMDFCIDDKLVLEMKVANGFYDAHIQQVLGYLKATDRKLGLLAVFTPCGVKIKRIINTYTSA